MRIEMAKEYIHIDNRKSNGCMNIGYTLNQEPNTHGWVYCKHCGRSMYCPVYDTGKAPEGGSGL
jgi:hypothetical protein